MAAPLRDAKSRQRGIATVSQGLTFESNRLIIKRMATFSTPQAAKQLGLTAAALGKYIAAKKIPSPQTLEVGGRRVYLWTERDIEVVRKLLPKIKNGRKTRYKKEREKTQQEQSKKKKES
jgi:hypothetical protein